MILLLSSHARTSRTPPMHRDLAPRLDNPAAATIAHARTHTHAQGLFKVLHDDAMAKSDLLVGVPAERGEWAGLAQLLACKPRVAAHAAKDVPA